MRDSDFSDVSDSDTPRELADAILAAFFPAPAPVVTLDSWQPMETAPKDRTSILVMYMHIDTQIVHNAFYIATDVVDDSKEAGWWTYLHSEVSRIKLHDWMTPTYWMPIPPAPTIKGDTK